LFVGGKILFVLVPAARRPVVRQTCFSFMVAVSMNRFQWTVSSNDALVRERRAFACH
jgi:hypothetical protein